MSKPCNHLAPANDPESQKPMGSLSYCDTDDCAAYTEEEHDAIMEQAQALADALYAAINAHSKTHPEMSYDVVLHALDCTAYCVRAQMHDNSADA